MSRRRVKTGALASDSRWTDKESKQLHQLEFPGHFKKSVDLSKVQMQVIRPWITARVTELLGIDDDVVCDYAFSLLEDADNTSPDPRKLQVALMGFLNQHAAQFVSELWTLLLSAQDSIGGIPQEFVEKKKRELAAQRAAQGGSGGPGRGGEDGGPESGGPGPSRGDNQRGGPSRFDGQRGGRGEGGFSSRGSRFEPPRERDNGYRRGGRGVGGPDRRDNGYPRRRPEDERDFHDSRRYEGGGGGRRREDIYSYSHGRGRGRSRTRSITRSPSPRRRRERRDSSSPEPRDREHESSYRTRRRSPSYSHSRTPSPGAARARDDRDRRYRHDGADRPDDEREDRPRSRRRRSPSDSPRAARRSFSPESGSRTPPYRRRRRSSPSRSRSPSPAAHLRHRREDSRSPTPRSGPSMQQEADPEERERMLRERLVNAKRARAA